ncbi:hypothetical protein K402DRAFT_389918 [Aulographum hederae CBS 113979]|uniref:Ribophorin II C-terminal domain-containing protein n=1 Tax=Aulographum hederae CBS 113979 TaxID=1176131 RepID=A0A6G1HB98_9PEZI|nr:hypothetical protein K402DRAFT_389918 [Aulographum hederae CBS 113979]
MKFSQLILASATFCASSVLAASWGFEDATISVQGKGSGVGGGVKEKFSAGSPLSNPIALGSSDTLKIILTTTEGKTGKRAHQAFLTLKEPVTGLEESFPFTLKESGKGKVDLTHKDLPTQFLTNTSPVEASIVIGSFGSSKPYNSKAFTLKVSLDASLPPPTSETPVRYGKQPEIHHIFRADPQSPPKIITIVFAAAVLAAVPVLFGAWLMLGANVNHLGKAMSGAPVAHALFFGSIVAMEGIFFMYYTTWNLFQMLPVAGVVGTVAFLSGSRALTEVQDRRVAGLR